MLREQRVQAVSKRLEGKHLPGCYERLSPLEDCICGGPERYMLLEAYVERAIECNALDRPQTALISI
jgi:hypothetical protein